MGSIHPVVRGNLRPFQLRPMSTVRNRSERSGWAAKIQHLGRRETFHSTRPIKRPLQAALRKSISACGLPDGSPTLVKYKPSYCRALERLWRIFPGSFVHRLTGRVKLQSYVVKVREAKVVWGLSRKRRIAICKNLLLPKRRFVLERRPFCGLTPFPPTRGTSGTTRA